MTFDPSAAAAKDSGIFGLPYTTAEARVVVVPVPFAATTSYGGGAQDGPRAIFDASKQVDLFDLELGRPYEAGIAMLEPSADVRAWHDRARPLAEKVLEVGGAIDGDKELTRACAEVNALSSRANEWVYETTRRNLADGKLVALIGGDHATPFGAIRAHAEKYPGLGVLHIDAHADLRVAYEGFADSHASIMYNVATKLAGVARIVQVGIRDFSEEEHAMIRGSGGRITTFFDLELAQRLDAGESWLAIVREIAAALPRDVYVSFDIDGLDPALCPRTGTPVPGGLSFHQANALLRAVVAANKRIVGLDLNEVAPGEGDEWDGNVGARLLYKMIGWMLKSQGN